MPKCNVALIADYARQEGGLAHLIGAGVDTIHCPVVPTVQPMGLLAVLEFSAGECGRPHRVEVIVQDQDGVVLNKVTGSIVPERDRTLPPGWPARAPLVLNLLVPIPDYGVYSLEVLADDAEMATIRFRSVPMPPGA